MQRPLGHLATLALALALGSGAMAQPSAASDPIGDFIGRLTAPADYHLRATLYHGGQRGMRGRDSLGCPVVAMRTAAVDGVKVPRRTRLFIRETVGLIMPDGSRHDGYWYASDVGPAIRPGRIDLFTGSGPASMTPLKALNMATVTVRNAGVFAGCPPGP